MQVGGVEPTIRRGTVIVPMKTAHVDQVVRVHLQSFPGFFLTVMGPRFLRLLYGEILKSPDHVAFVALDEASDMIIGFVAGVTKQSNFYGRLARQNWFNFALVSIPVVLRHPTIVPRLLRAFTYSKKTQSAAAQALLMSIAVLPGSMGRGIGQLLANQFLTAMWRQGIMSVSLTTDRVNNERTNRFYHKLGFEIARTYVTPEGRWMNEYVIDLTTWSPS